MNTIKFDEWKFLCTLPFQAEFSKDMQQGVMKPSLFNWMPATVPGSVYEDLQNNNIITDPYVGQNSLNCEWVASRWWVYKTSFAITKSDLESTLKLCFKGIDYSAQIYLNGKKLGHHEGMYIPFEAIVNDFVVTDKENVLVCIIEHAPFCDPQPGYTSKTRYMKARFNYKWDFATRLINLGIYDEVTLTKHNACSIASSFVRTLKNGDDFDVLVELELDGYYNKNATISVEYSCKGEVLSVSNTDISLIDDFNKFKTSFKATTPKLWWPNGYGEQNLYDISVKVVCDGKISDQKDHKIGFRTLEYIHADGRDDALPYCVVINGKKIYLKGTNFVPLCHLQGSIKYAELQQKLMLAKECNINYVRIWGGGHIESESFYDLCDQYGIMIMQEFTMSSSGCDDVPSKNTQFVELLHKVAVYNAKLKRNHTCLTFWCGGNELTDERYLGRPDHEAHPATFEDKTLAMLKGIVNTLSPDVMMLPASASGPNALLKKGDIGNNHDVHGPWNYAGVVAHYDLYNNSDSIVHGEFGCGGISNFETLKRFLAPDDLKLFTNSENQTWRHHTGGWDSYNSREHLMFGDLRNIPFVDYIKVNQFVQAESLRYSLEANRRRQWHNVGQMTWQFNEPWPNVQCSNVVDYFGGKKLAYYFMRDAYDSVLLSMKYDKLFYTAGEDFRGELIIINDCEDSAFTVCYDVVSTAGVAFASGRFEGVAVEDIATSIGKIEFSIPMGTTGGFIIKLKTKCGKYENEKSYLMLIADKNIPVTISDTDMLSINPRAVAYSYDGLRADYIPVVEYVDSIIRT